MSVLKKEYATTAEAVEEARHWILNTACHYSMVDNPNKSEGMNEAVAILDEFLSRVKK